MTAIDDYLAQLGRQLETSPEEAEEVLREVRSHLELCMLDLARHGADEAQRLSRAIGRFGAVRQIGAELRAVHGRATWAEAGLAVLPVLLFTWLAMAPLLRVWVAPVLLVAAVSLATAQARHARWPLWGWAWLGWLPFALPRAAADLLWGAAAYLLILLLVIRRDWLQATLALYPLSTAWAFHSIVLASYEVQSVGWSPAALHLLTLGMACLWALMLMRVLRTPPGRAFSGQVSWVGLPAGGQRVVRVLQGHGLATLLNALVVVAARLWPGYPFPYPFALRYFIFVTLPYASFSVLPFALFFLLSSLPATMSLVQMRAQRQRPPSRPAVGG